MTLLNQTLQLGIAFLILTGCTNTTPTVAIQNTHTPTKETILPTFTQVPTNTSAPCPPRWETELPNPDIPENYIGKIFRTLPEGLDDLYQGIIADFSKEPDYNFAFGEVVNNNTRIRMLWFQKLVCDNEGKAYFEIIDIAAIPLDENEIVMEPGYCLLDNIPDPEIFALGEQDATHSEIETMKQAWRANRVTGKIEELSLDGITCTGEGVANE